MKDRLRAFQFLLLSHWFMSFPVSQKCILPLTPHHKTSVYRPIGKQTRNINLHFKEEIIPRSGCNIVEQKTCFFSIFFYGSSRKKWSEEVEVQCPSWWNLSACEGNQKIYHTGDKCIWESGLWSRKELRSQLLCSPWSSLHALLVGFPMASGSLCETWCWIRMMLDQMGHWYGPAEPLLGLKAQTCWCHRTKLSKEREKERQPRMMLQRLAMMNRVSYF